jgi:hypothetical protein
VLIIRVLAPSGSSPPVPSSEQSKDGQFYADAKRQARSSARPHHVCDAVALTQPWRVVRVCDDCASSSAARERQRIGEHLASSSLVCVSPSPNAQSQRHRSEKPLSSSTNRLISKPTHIA